MPQQEHAPHHVTLTLGSTGQELTTWDRYTIVQSVFDAGNPFTFSLWYSKTQRSAWQNVLTAVKLGDRLTLAIDGAPQLTGRIEALTVNHSRKAGACLVITGRDLAGPAIDWDADPRTVIRGKPLDETLIALFKPLGIEPACGVDAIVTRDVQSRKRRGRRARHHSGAPARRRHRRVARRRTVDIAHPKPKERIWAVAERIVKKMGYMMWVAPSDDTGALAVVIDKPDYEQTATFVFKRELRDGRITRDSNVLDSTFHAQIRTIPTVVYAWGRAERGDKRGSRHRVAHTVDRLPPMYRDVQDIGNAFLNSLGLTIALPGAVPPPVPPAPHAPTRPPATRMPFGNDRLQYPFVIDPLPPQPRFLDSKRARDPATASQEVKRCIAHAMKDFRTVEIVVRGHGQHVGDDDRLYAVNLMCRYRDDLLSIDEDMFIQRVEFMGSRKDGQLTKLTLGTKGAISLEPDAE